MRGMVEKLMMFVVMSVMSFGGAVTYHLIAGEEGESMIDRLANLVDWNNVAEVVTAALGGY